MATLPLGAGQFKRSLGRGDSIRAKTPAPPEIRIGRATLAIDVKDATGGGANPGIPTTTVDPANPSGGAIVTPPATQLQAALDQVFRESFTIVQANGEALLRVAIVHYTPAESAIRSFQQKVRVPAADPAAGQPTEKTVPVEQWIARGQIALRVEVLDSTGVLIDGFAPQASVQANQIVSVDSQDRVDRTQLPSSDQVLAKLIGDLAVQFRPRYCPPAIEMEVPLAVDEELRAGNQLARNGDFSAAAKSWEAATITKPQNAGDRIHNLGSVYEAQAYDLLMKQAELTKVEPYLERAAARYAEAAKLDPEEKYLTRAQERVRKATGLVEVLKNLEQNRQRVLAARAAPSPWPPAGGQAWSGTGVVTGGVVEQPPANTGTTTTTGAVTQSGAGQSGTTGTGPFSIGELHPPQQQGTTVQGQVQPAATSTVVDPALQEALDRAINEPRPDTPQEAVFRQFVRLRLRSGALAIDEAAKRQIESTGPLGYSLSALAAKRVVHQESQSWSAAQPKLSAYRDSFAAFAQDGRIVAEERAVLKVLAKNLALTEAEVKEIEAAWKVAE